MKIEFEVPRAKLLMTDLEYGEVFSLFTDNELYMRTDQGSAVRLSDGTIMTQLKPNLTYCSRVDVKLVPNINKNLEETSRF